MANKFSGAKMATRDEQLFLANLDIYYSAIWINSYCSLR